MATKQLKIHIRFHEFENRLWDIDYNLVFLFVVDKSRETQRASRNIFTNLICKYFNSNTMRMLQYERAAIFIMPKLT